MNVINNNNIIIAFSHFLKKKICHDFGYLCRSSICCKADGYNIFYSVCDVKELNTKIQINVHKYIIGLTTTMIILKKKTFVNNLFNSVGS